VFSIETRYHEVAEEALSRGFDMVNDIAGFADPEMPRVCAEYDVAVGKMASPPDLKRPGAVEETDWAARRSPEWAAGADYVDRVYEALKQHGLTDKTIVDPAFGGWSEDKTIADDRETFRRLREFRAIGQPILVSINRKNFLGELADRTTEEALPASLAATSMAVERGARVVRTHDVAETRDAALVGDEFARDRVLADGVEELDVTTVREAGRYFADTGADGTRAVSRVFALRDLDTAATERLREAAAGVDVAVTTAGESVFLGGSVAGLRALADRTQAPDAVAEALSRERTGG